MAARKAVLVALAPVLGGCFALPPSRWSASASAAHTLREETAALGQLRGDIRPLGASPSLARRRADVAVGFHADLGKNTKQYGPSTSAGVFPVVKDDVRLYAGAEARFLRDQDAKIWGPFAAAQTSLEIGGFTRACGAADKGVAVGCAYGEGYAGVLAEAAIGSMDGQTLWSVSFGLTFRTPALVGFALPIP